LPEGIETHAAQGDFTVGIDLTPAWGDAMSIVWSILIGFVVGIVAKLVTPGDPKPQGFILTTVLGIVGALLATWLGQAVGWYQPGQTAGFVGSIVGAVIILLIWRQIAVPRRS
jgi:uncharacterized membrane protein YeaQ/YmgE (transglycosylase-associated protein family)